MASSINWQNATYETTIYNANRINNELALEIKKISDAVNKNLEKYKISEPTLTSNFDKVRALTQLENALIELQQPLRLLMQTKGINADDKKALDQLSSTISTNLDNACNASNELLVECIREIKFSPNIDPDKKARVLGGIKAILDDPYYLEMPSLKSTSITHSHIEKNTPNICSRNTDAVSTSEKLQPVPTHPTKTSIEKSTPDNRSKSTSAVNVIEELQTIISLFQFQFQEALQKLTALGSQTSESPFNILDRTYFHLYFIHKNESPGNLRDDRNYGKNAMDGIYPTSNADRIRAIQRTRAEFALQAVQKAVESNHFEGVILALNTLEKKLQMQQIDMPPGQYNLAYMLFGQMYHKHVEARKSNGSLVDPHHSQFNGDFGRNAFCTNEGINPSVKIAAIEEVRQALKKAWNIP